MSHLFDLSERIAVVTGGYGHLGKAIVKTLSDFGATVCVLGRNEKKFHDVFVNQTHIKPEKKIFFQHCDLLRHETIPAAITNCAQKLKKIDILVNNAASVDGRIPDQLTPDQITKTLQACLGSVMQVTTEAAKFMENGASIINISSMYGIVSPDFTIYQDNDFLNPPHYGAAKAGVLQLTRYYAIWFAPRSIRVNAITPGAFPSAKVQQNPEFISRLEKKIPLGRIGVPSDLSGALLLLASDAGSYITGQNIIIDGGWTAW